MASTNGMTSRSMKSSRDQPSTGRARNGDPPAARRASSSGLRHLAQALALVDAEHVDGDEDRNERAACHEAAEHVHRVVGAEVHARAADGEDQGRCDDIGEPPLAVVVREARDTEGREAIERCRSERVPRGKVGDVVEPDVVDVEQGAHERAERHRIRRGEVLQRPLDGEAQRPEREEDREVAAPAAQREEAEDREGTGDEPPAAERADRHDQDLDRREIRPDPPVHGLDDVRHEPLLRRRVDRRALEHHEPEQGREGDEREQERSAGAGDRASESVSRVVADDEAPHGIGEPTHAA
jgi:hypothetical protein